MPLSYESIPEFDKDFKKLLKKFPTLSDDLGGIKKNVIELLHIHKINNNACFEIPGYCLPEFSFFKVKKFACKSLKGKGSKSGLRLIYTYFHAEERVIFHEIYYKGNKSDLDYSRADEYKNNYQKKIQSLV